MKSENSDLIRTCAREGLAVEFGIFQKGAKSMVRLQKLPFAPWFWDSESSGKTQKAEAVSPALFKAYLVFT